MASMFHLFTHAFFKALLFLGAGSVIHAVHSNEMDQMGGLHKYMKLTSITFLIACLAIAGIPPFSGFFSKDEILAAAYEHQPVVFWTLWIVAGLTAFYMFRLYFRIFWNGERTYDAHHKPHESPWVMTVPLIILAVFSSIDGFIPFDEFVSSDLMPFHAHIDWLVASLSVLAAVIGIGIAAALYFKESRKPAELAQSMGIMYKAALHKFYLDELWIWFTTTVVFRYICEPIKWFDRHIVDGSMNGIAWTTQKASASIRGLQSGQVQFYAWVFIFGSLLIAALVLFL
jgi:NADH-quinone oxidoreductase subunit L